MEFAIGRILFSHGNGTFLNRSSEYKKNTHKRSTRWHCSENNANLQKTILKANLPVSVCVCFFGFRSRT